MAYKATIAFAGRKISMRRGEVKEITDEALAKDLIKAGYVIELEGKKPLESKPEASKPKTSSKKTAKKAVKEDGKESLL